MASLLEANSVTAQFNAASMGQLLNQGDEREAYDHEDVDDSVEMDCEEDSNDDMEPDEGAPFQPFSSQSIFGADNQEQCLENFI